MPILNYMTEVPAERTIAEIQKILAKAGAGAVMTEYGAGGITRAISFRILCRGVLVSFQLPAHVGRVQAILEAETDRHVTRKQRTWAHAERVAWRIIKDWIEAQMALVQAEQADVLEVFLPYAQDPASGRTMYQRASELLALPHQPQE